MLISWDTETCPIRPALSAPPLVCVSMAREDGEERLVHRNDAEPLLRDIITNHEMTLAFAGFDLCVVGTEFPSLMLPVFDALAEDRVYDTLNRQKLYDIADGRYSSTSKPRFFRPPDSEKAVKIFYDLSTTHHRLCGTPLKKDTWRLLYAQLLPHPISEWPEGAQHYSLEDSRANLRVHNKQEQYPDAEQVFMDQFRQNRAHMALYLISCWGIRTDSRSVRELDLRLQQEWEEARQILLAEGLVRKTGSKNTKLAKQLMYETRGLDCKLTEAGERLLAVHLSEFPATESGYKQALKKTLEMFSYKYVSLDSESCEDSGHKLLKKYKAYTHIQKIRGTYVSALYNGVSKPIQTRFEVLLETGRTSSSKPNIQNPPREPGVRECFVPRPGCVFAVVDYDLAELRSLAQVCLKSPVIGFSNLAEALNKGFDPHLSMAAQILGISYEEASRMKSGTKEEKAKIKEMRTLGKCANFGFPGGLGAETFIQFAKGTYNVTITEAQARALKQEWLRAWPEMRKYFNMVNNLLESRPEEDEEDEEASNVRPLNGGRPIIVQHLSERCRGDVTYTQACNTYFQGLTADAAKEALWEITRRQFTDPSSSLYGTHMVNFVHDEIILEVEEWRAHEAAEEMCALMIEVYNRWTPDVPMTAQPVLMRRWSKNAPDVCPRDANGRLIPYEDAA